MRQHSFIDSLGVGSCIDYQNNAGKWEIVFVERFSNSRTEIQVTLPNGELFFHLSHMCMLILIFLVVIVNRFESMGTLRKRST